MIEIIITGHVLVPLLDNLLNVANALHSLSHVAAQLVSSSSDPFLFSQYIA